MRSKSFFEFHIVYISIYSKLLRQKLRTLQTADFEQNWDYLPFFQILTALSTIFWQVLHRGEAVLRKHLRSFENQINNIIRRTKGKRTMIKFHQFYSAKKIPELKTAKNPIFLNGKP